MSTETLIIVLVLVLLLAVELLYSDAGDPHARIQNPGCAERSLGKAQDDPSTSPGGDRSRPVQTQINPEIRMKGQHQEQS